MSGPAEEHPSEGAPEWMVSYADMITIMMAFFVVMYAMAGSKDPKKQEPVMSSMRRQFGRFAASPKGPLVPRNSSLAGVGDGMSPPVLVKKASMEGPPSIRLRPGEKRTVGLVIYFEEGKSDLTPEHKKRLGALLEEIAGKPQKIEIRGHTSSRPLPADGAYHDSWDLAYGRCRKTLEYLAEQGVDSKRIRLGVAGVNEPLYTGLDAPLLSKNGRVEVFMLNEFVESGREEESSEPVAGH